jgi:hypothetical protein
MPGYGWTWRRTDTKYIENMAAPKISALTMGYVND